MQLIMKQCQVENCDQKYYCKGFCRIHYGRWKAHNDPLITLKQKNRKCCIENCDGLHEARGFCNMHYKRWLVHGDPLKTLFNYSCKIEGCDKKHMGKGYCIKHYARVYLKGNPLYSIYDLTINERLQEKMIINSENNCWEWNACLNNHGYGLVTIHGKVGHAHRRSYEAFIGKIPKGLFVLHHCDNRACINPDHLFLGTNKDNMSDMKNKGRARTCHGEDNKNSKLKSEEVKEIKKLLQNGKSLYSLATQYNVSPATIWNIRVNKSWRHIN